MNTEVQPPRALPLRVVGWLSLPWRHWVYISTTLLFGLFFATLAPVPFLVRLLVLLIPFLTALGLAMPYGGLHMDEWLLLALKYRMRPTAKTISHEELKGLAPEALEALLETPPGAQTASDPVPSSQFLASRGPSAAGAAAGAAPHPASVSGAGIAADASLASGQMTGGVNRQEANTWAASGQDMASTGAVTRQVYLAGTHGILRRGYSGVPEATSPTAPPVAPAPGGVSMGPQEQVEISRQPTARQAPSAPAQPFAASLQPDGKQAPYMPPIQPMRSSQADANHWRAVPGQPARLAQAGERPGRASNRSKKRPDRKWA